MNKIEKYTFEKYAYALDFIDKLVGVESLAGGVITIIATEIADGHDATAEVIATDPAPSISGTQILFTATGGKPGEQYTIAVKVTMSDSQQYEGTVQLGILEED